MSGPERFDVVVVGGGPAGLAASLASARAGAETLLVEREAQLGGNAAQALVHTICGLYRSDTERPEPIHAGLPNRIAEALARAGDAGEPVAAGRVFYLPIRPAGFSALARALVERSAGLTLALRANVVAAHLAAGGSEDARLRLAGPSGEREVSASQLVDASGDAAAAALAGAGFEQTPVDRLQRTSFIVRVTGVAAADLDDSARLRLTARVANAARRGVLPVACASLVARPAAQSGDGLYLTLTLPSPTVQPFTGLDAEQIGRLSRSGRRLVGRALDFLRREHEGFANARVADWPARVGIRETRRLRGRSVVERDDVLLGRRCEDEVARSGWPIELWEDHRRARFAYPIAPCSIPLGALVSATHPSLGAAGRCLSASHEAHGALRVIGTALATGEAIGIAAALAADGGGTLATVEPARVRARIQDDAEKPLP
jgi:hypothetical protein